MDGEITPIDWRVDVASEVRRVMLEVIEGQNGGSGKATRTGT